MATTAIDLSGTRKAAIFAVMLGEDRCGEIFKYLEDDEIEAIVREVAKLGTVATDTGEQVLEEFSEMWGSAAYASRGGLEFARKLTVKSLGADHARKVLDRALTSLGSTKVVASLEKTDPQQLSKFIAAEHPQTIALILAHLKTAQAAEIVKLLPEDVRTEAITRMANLDEISPDVIARIMSVIEQRLKAIGTQTHESYGGTRAVAELLNTLEKGVTDRVLETIERGSSELATSIRNLMFVFDDLATLDDTALREIIQRADKKGLAVALKGASLPIKTRFFENMSKRAGEMIKEDMDVMGAVRLREVEKAQQEILVIARTMEEEGLIVTGGSASESYVT